MLSLWLLVSGLSVRMSYKIELVSRCFGLSRIVFHCYSEFSCWSCREQHSQCIISCKSYHRVVCIFCVSKCDWLGFMSPTVCFFQVMTSFFGLRSINLPVCHPE